MLAGQVDALLALARSLNEPRQVMLFLYFVALLPDQDQTKLLAAGREAMDRVCPAEQTIRPNVENA